MTDRGSDMAAEMARIVIYNGFYEDGDDGVTIECSEGLTVLSAIGLVGYAQAVLAKQVREGSAP